MNGFVLSTRSRRFLSPGVLCVLVMQRVVAERAARFVKVLQSLCVNAEKLLGFIAGSVTVLMRGFMLALRLSLPRVLFPRVGRRVGLKMFTGFVALFLCSVLAGLTPVL